MTKLTTILLFVSFLQLSAASYSQSVKLSLNLKNATIQEVLGQIEKQSEYRFFYDSDLVDLSKRKSVQSLDKPLADILKEVFDGTDIDYELKDRIILVRSKTTSRSIIEMLQGKITGNVVDEAGLPLPGVAIMIKGTTQGTITDPDGNFALDGINAETSLVFSFVGMTTQEVQVANQSVINVTLEADAIGLEEVVAIGYGTAKKSDLTGAVVNVKAEDIIKYKPESAGDMLRAAVPGLVVGYSTDAKNTPGFEIRGDNSLTKDGNKPLIVIDGVIFNGDLADINVNDIETIDVLKDASSSSIYGSRATNGVVVFTTKKGKKGNTVIRARAKYSLVGESRRITPYKPGDVLRFKEDVNVALDGNYDGTEAFSRYSDPRSLSGSDLTSWLEGTDENTLVETWMGRLGYGNKEVQNYMNNTPTDWADYMFHVGKRQSYDVSISGKGETVAYYWSINYKDSESVQVGEKFTTINSRINLDASIGSFLNVGINAQFVYQDDSGIGIDNGSYHRLSVYDTPYDADGNLELAAAGSNQRNPLLNPNFIDKQKDYYKFFPTAYATVKLPLGIKFTSRFTQRLEFSRYNNFESPENPNWASTGGKAKREHTQLYEWQTDNILNWNKSFGDHRIDFTGLWNAERYQKWNTKTSNQDFIPTYILGYHNMSYGTNPGIDTDDYANTGTALMGRINYSYGLRYNLSASFRRDGSSRFGTNNSHANFPSVSAGWTISEESFFKDKISWFSYLKMRASWGINGNSSGIGRYDAVASLSDNKYLNASWDGNFYTVPYMYVNRMANPNLAWEKAESWNVGFDFAVLGDRLRGAIDGYYTKTEDLLLAKQLPIVTGFGSVTTNVGSVENRGVELSLNSVNIQTNDLRWTTSLNFSYNKNKIVSLTGNMVEKRDADGNVILGSDGNPVMYEPDDLSNGWFIGEDKSVIWDYKVLGTWNVDEAEEAALFGQKPGDFRLQDTDGNGTLNNDDKQFLGTETPPAYFSMTNNVQYKNFDLGIVVLGKIGYYDDFNLAKNNGEDFVKNNNWYDMPYWTASNPNSEYARIQSNAPVGFNVWKKKSYVRIQSLSLGYNLPNHFLQTIGFNSARVALNVDNVAVFAPNWDYGDPESSKEMPRTVSLSVDVSF